MPWSVPGRKIVTKATIAVSSSVSSTAAETSISTAAAIGPAANGSASARNWRSKSGRITGSANFATAAGASSRTAKSSWRRALRRLAARDTRT